MGAAAALAGGRGGAGGPGGAVRACVGGGGAGGTARGEGVGRGVPRGDASRAAAAGTTVSSRVPCSRGATIAVSRPPSGTMRTRTSPRSATYSNSVSAIWSMRSADSDGATSTSSA
ncbi:MAG: hypothetical protein DMD47_06200 [Gemmatimonadetes bacterium]|nr:MAG: hypothetical protein DMD47_06200 [Gemmatimonadota bacterium]